MNSAVINFKVTPLLKKQAQKVISDEGLTLSGILKDYLRRIVETKSVKTASLPYGMFPGSKISEEEIDKISSSWNKTINEIG